MKSYEGKMEIGEPDANGNFKGWFKPKGGGDPQEITGKCSGQNPHMTIERPDTSRGKHTYKGAKLGANHMKGKHNHSSAGRNKSLDEDEWIATKTTRRLSKR